VNNKLSQVNNAIIDINDIKSGLRTFSKNWYVIAIALVISFLGSYYYTYKLTDVYAASSQILLKSNDTYDVQSTITQNMGSSGGAYHDYTDNYNAIRVVKSYDLIKKAIDRLNFGTSYYIIGRLKSQEVYESLPFAVTMSTINSGLYERMINIRFIDDKRYELSYKIGEEEFNKIYYFDKPAISENFNLLVIKAKGVDKSNVQPLVESRYAVQFHETSQLVINYQTSLTCEIPDYTGIIQLTIEDILPQRAVSFLDTLGQVYIENTLQSKLSLNQRTIEFIDVQLTELSSIISNIENKLQDYKHNKSIYDLTREEQIVFNAMTEAVAKQKQLNFQLDALKTLEKYIVEDKTGEVLPPSYYMAIEDEFLKGSMLDLYKLQLQKTQDYYKNTKTSFEANEINSKIKNLKTILIGYINNSKILVLKKINEYVAIEKDTENKIGDIPIKQREVSNIQRHLDVNQKMYEYLIERKANSTIAKAGIIPECKIIETARSKGVVRPNKSRITYSFLGVGFIISIIIIFLITMFFERLESLDELKSKTQLNILGEILQTLSKKHQENSILGADPKSAFIESFRIVRANLQYLKPIPNSKVYLFTSRNPGEGKTFCSLNMSILLAKGGKKVILLEFDMHKPRVSSALNMNAHKGLSTILIGKDKPEDCVQKSAQEGLDVMLCGPIPPNASELILNDYMKELFLFCRNNYDYVIIDTPPVGMVSDALVMMEYSDINIFVINTKFPYRESLNLATEITKMNKNATLALLLNGVKKNKIKYYLSKYGYGDSYGYGYGYGYSYSNSVNR
jgi:capsular exopolysaccharide synthesis family protein